MTDRTVRIGAGAGYSGDRIEPAVELAEHGRLDYLAFECLAERTIALAQAARQRDPEAGFDVLLERRFRAVLPIARSKGVRIISNMGAANPLGAARMICRIARELGFPGLRCAAILGDDVIDIVRARPHDLSGAEGTSETLGARMISANAYVGAFPIAQALSDGADVVITGRVGDPALFLGPLIHEFGWAEDDWTHLGRGTIIGHLLECAGQLTGGYFADPGMKDVPGLARLGFPLAEVKADGSAIFTKVDGSGGRLTAATCREQLLYEIMDPAAYIQPDVIADLTSVAFTEVGPDRVAFVGGDGRERPASLKVSVGYRDGFIGEGQISYAGPGAVARGRLAIDIVRERLELTGVLVREFVGDLIGVDAVDRTETAIEPREVRVRVAARTDSVDDATQIGAEVEALYTNGPSGGGGAARMAREVIAIASTFVSREKIRPQIIHEVA